jgi:hypothetical protein
MNQAGQIQRELTFAATELREPILVFVLPAGSRGSSCRIMRTKGFGKAGQVLRVYMNKAVARGINVRDEHERDGNQQRQNREQSGFRPGAAGAIADQQIAADGNRSD